MNETRNEQGYPCFDGPTTRPRARLECAPGSAIGGSVNLDQHTDNSVNKALPWVAIACLLAGMSLGVSLMSQPIMDAKIERAKAELLADFSQRIARTEALSELARKEASTAKDMVDLDRAKAKAREELKHER